jgi:hypothetical protein
MRTVRFALLTLAAFALAAFSPAAFGVFHNDTDSTVVGTIVNTRGHSFRAHVIPPHGAARFPITNGTAIARTTSGKTLARKYYDFPSRGFYYRITPNRIELARPESAREWLRSGLTNR